MQKENFFATYSFGKTEKDTGSPESQVAQLTFLIKSLTIHLQTHKKDKDSLQRGLKKMVGRRQRMLKYLNKISVERYQGICKKLSIKGIKHH